MPQTFLDSLVVNAVGTHQPATILKWPEGGAAVQVSLSAGTATVKLKQWNEPTRKVDVLLFTLPIPAGQPNAGAMTDLVQVANSAADFEWEVLTLTGGGQLRLSVNGPGL